MMNVTRSKNISFKGKIIDGVKTGYPLNEKGIRHSQVAVGL